MVNICIPVCKRWHAASQDSWYNFKELNFLNQCWGFNRSSSVDRINSRIIKKILRRCGKFLIAIEFSEPSRRLGPNVLNLIAKSCPNIQIIDASELEVSPSCIRALAYNCNKITSFSIGDCTDDCDVELSLLFEKNRKLSSLFVNCNFEVTGECLSKLNTESIKSIIFENCPSISLKHFKVSKIRTLIRIFCTSWIQFPRSLEKNYK